MGKFSRMRFTKRHVGIVQPLEGKDDILSVEVARGLEPRRGMEFHAAPQVECDYPSIFRNFPAFGETRFDACRIFRFVFQQPIEDRCCTVDSIPASLVSGSNPLGLISEQYTRGFVGKARFVRLRAYARLEAISRMTDATLIRRTQTV